MSWLGGNWLLISHDMPSTEALATYELIITSAAEDYAANCIHINDQVLIPAGYPELAPAWWHWPLSYCHCRCPRTARWMADSRLSLRIQ